MTNLSNLAPNGKAATESSTFGRATAVCIDIHADTSIIWALLTNAADFSRWNSTIISIEGEIKLGEKIRLKATLDPSRTFKIKIMESIPEKLMVWGDGMGRRKFELEQLGERKTRFTMHEKMGSMMFPLFASKIPPFDQAFEDYAADLKREAELIQNAK